MSRPSLADLLGLETPEPHREKRSLPSVDVQARVLTDLLADYQRPCPFRVGDLIRQRKEYKSYRWPVEDQLAMVVDVMAGDQHTPIAEGANSLERPDMIMLVQTPDGSWSKFAVESWRFAKYEGDVA